MHCSTVVNNLILSGNVSKRVHPSDFPRKLRIQISLAGSRQKVCYRQVFRNDASFDPLHEDELVVSDYAVVSAGESRNPAYLIHWQVQDQPSSSNEMLKPSSFNVDMKIPDYIARV